MRKRDGGVVASANCRDRKHRGGEQPAIRSVPPTFGQHNQEILGGILGLPGAGIDQLIRDGIIGTEMPMEEQLVKEKKRAAG
jgi:hypothetical protein